MTSPLFVLRRPRAPRHLPDRVLVYDFVFEKCGGDRSNARPMLIDKSLGSQLQIVQIGAGDFAAMPHFSDAVPDGFEVGLHAVPPKRVRREPLLRKAAR
jgi:hypothetical protein